MAVACFWLALYDVRHHHTALVRSILGQGGGINCVNFPVETPSLDASKGGHPANIYIYIYIYIYISVGPC